MTIKITSILNNKLRATLILLKNVVFSRKLHNFQKLIDRDIVIDGADSETIHEALLLYGSLNNGSTFAGWRNFLLKTCPSKLCLVAIDNKTRNVIGVNIYYLNIRDFNETTIHEGFIGVKPEFRQRGIAEKMRRHALANFISNNVINGVSSRVSLNNTHSLNGLIRLGFSLKEEYFDQQLQKNAAYFVCDLDDYRSGLKNI